MKRIKFTKKNLENISLPSNGKRVYIYDEKIHGLALSATYTGTKSFLVYRKINNKPIRVTLGHFPDMTVEQARKKALEALSKIAEGINPIKEKHSKATGDITLKDTFTAYLQTRKNLKPLTVIDYQKVIRNTYPDWLNKPLKSINSEMVINRHKKRGERSPARANNAFRVLRALFNFARVHYEDSKGESLFPNNPVDKLSASKAWFKIKRKQSYIHKSDLPIWFKTVTELQSSNPRAKLDVIKDYLLFLLFTGTRREEAAQLKWENVNLKEKTFTLIDPKNRETITLPMSDYVYNLIDMRSKKSYSDFVFQGNGKTGHLVEPRKQILRVKKLSGVTFTLHDLRRTFATIAESLELSRYTLKRLLNHKISDSADITAGYIVPNIERLSKATQRITEQILTIANGENSIEKN